MRRINRMKIYIGVLFKHTILIILNRKASRVRKEEHCIKHVTTVVRITRQILLLLHTVENMTLNWFLHS
jgi:hypothetical protein